MHTTDTLHEMRRLLESDTGARKQLSDLVKLPDRISTNTASTKPTAPKADVYEGTYQENKRNGKGTMNYANGDVYTGLWLDNERNGQGNMTYANGNTYQGSWKADKMKGTGKFIHKPPEQEQFDWKFCGEFDNDFPVCGTLTYKQNETCNQTYAAKWSQLDIQAQMPSTTSTKKQEKSGVDPKSDNLSDEDPQETERINFNQSVRESARNDAEEEKGQRNHNTFGTVRAS